ncbi:MAG: hypothetical protein RI897_2699 [Verrucomicrobiota bacterium]
MFEDIAAGGLEELIEFTEIILPPGAFEAGAVAEGGEAAGLAGFGVNDVVFGIDGAAGEQGVAAEGDVMFVGVVGELADLGEVIRVFILHIEAAAEGEDDEFEADVSGLVDGEADVIGLCGADVEDEGVFGGPGCDGAVHAGQGEGLADLVGAIVEQDPGAEGGEGGGVFQGIFRAEWGCAFEEAGGLEAVIDLGGVGGVGEPLDGLALGGAASHGAGGEVGFDVDIGEFGVEHFLDFTGGFDAGEDFAFEGIDCDGEAGVVFDGEPFGEEREMVIDGVVDFDRDSMEVFGVWGSLEDEGEFEAWGRPGCGLGDPLGAGFPLEAGLDGVGAEPDELEGVGMGGERG